MNVSRHFFNGCFSPIIDKPRYDIPAFFVFCEQPIICLYLRLGNVRLPCSLKEMCRESLL